MAKTSYINSRYASLKNDGTLYSIAVCAIVSLGQMANGLGNGYTSAAIPNINSNRNPFHVNSEESSWYSGINHLAAIPGGLVAGPIADRFGRKPALLMTILPFTVGWLMTASAGNVYVMYVGRVFVGFSQGLSSGACTVYLVEVAPLKIRGALASFGNTGYSLGKLYDYVFGAFLSWNWLAVTNIAVNLLTIFCLTFVPETPRWLLSKSSTEKGTWKKEEAERNLKRLRGGRNADVSAELKEVQESAQKRTKQVSWVKFVQKKNMAHLGICLVILLVFQMGGAIVVTQYTVTIFDSSHSSMDPNTQTIVVGVTDVVGSLLCTFCLDFFGRRIMLLASTFAMAVSFTSLGVYFYVDQVTDPQFAAEHLSWLPLTSLMLNEFMLNTGIGALIWIMPGELFSTETRGKALSVAVAFSHSCQFLAIKYFPDVVSRIGMYGGFWICAAIDVFGVIFFFFFVPETAKKSLEQLQDELNEEITS